MTQDATDRRGGLAGPITLQRLEGLVALGAGVLAYAALGQSWLFFALMFFVPDLVMLGYLRSPRVGALVYNLGHTYVAPAALAAVGYWSGPVVLGLAAIWFAHIGFDRLLGYGLKFESFGMTHLGPIGRVRG